MSSTITPAGDLSLNGPGGFAARRRWWRGALSVVLFLSGGVVGSGVTLVLMHNQRMEVLQHPERARDRIVPTLQQKLDLSAEQVQKIEQIVHTRHEALHALREEVHPRFERQLNLMDEQIGAVLNAEQKAKWDASFEDGRSSWLPRRPPKPAEKTRD